MAEKDNPAAEGSFLSHLLELRNRVLYALIGVGAVFGVLVFFANEIYVLVARPLLQAMPQGAGMIATEIASPFLAPIKLTLILSFVAAAPLVLYQLWAFVAPGLYRHERRLVLPLLVSSTLLFYGGMAFAYFVVFPVVFQFFVSTAPPGITVMTDIKAYLDFVLSMFLAFGIAFEVPVALVLLTRMGAINPERLAQQRPYVVLWVFIIAAVLTPPDVFSQIFLAIPMLLLFEVGLFIARRVRPSPGEAAHRELTQAQMQAEFEKHDRDLSGKN